MFPSYMLENPALEIVKAFVTGELEIAAFMERYYADDTLPEYLNSIVDYIAEHHIPVKRRTIFMKNVNQNKPFAVRSEVEIFILEYARELKGLSEKWKENPPRVGEYLKTQSHETAYGAYKIHEIVSDIYYQIDFTIQRTEKYRDEYEFSLDVLPGYLAGGIFAENYVSQYILSKYPATMKKGERKRLVKEAIKLAFRRECKGFPRWIQMPEWPMDDDGKPMVYTGQKAFQHRTEYYFRDEKKEMHTITQWW